MAEEMFDGAQGGVLGDGPGVGSQDPAGVAGSDGFGTGEADWGFLPEGMQSLRDGFDSPESFWTALGRPERPDGYALPETWGSDGVSPDMAAKVNEVLSGDREAFMNVCHKCNLTGKQAETLFGVVGGLMAESMRQEAADVPDAAQVVTSLWPKDTHRHLDAARRGARYAGLGDELDSAGLSANPLVLRLAKALGEAVGESSAPGSKGYAAGLPRGERAREEMYRVIASDAYRNNDPEAIRKVEALSRRVDIG